MKKNDIKKAAAILGSIKPYDEARDAENARAIALAMLQGMDEILQARADMLVSIHAPARGATVYNVIAI